ncbi:MAG: 23S rRNA (adenine(2503)-C(2))-methyltransferase RlmN [Planctomycetales bacterium]
MLSSVTSRALCDLSHVDLVAWCAAQGEPAYRAGQVRRWLFEKRAASFDDMADLPRALREALAAEFGEPLASRVVRHQVARDRTEKLLLELADGSTVECVLMREPKRRTVCISTQVGCAMGCVFCASGLLGVKRNLTAGEIIEQVLRADRLLDPGERLTNVVVMGIGEPLANLANLLPALETLASGGPQPRGGLGLSPRRFTVSTVGLPDKIREFAEVGHPYNLAVSLHAPNDRLRTDLVPVNKNIGIAAILDAADHYFEKTGRRVTYEYVLLGGINDGTRHANELAERLRGRHAHVNLIPMNAVAEMPFRDPTPERVRRFVEILEAAGVAATIRKRKGADIDAACGQLRLKSERQNGEPVAR